MINFTSGEKGAKSLVPKEQISTLERDRG